MTDHTELADRLRKGLPLPEWALEHLTPERANDFRGKTIIATEDAVQAADLLSSPSPIPMDEAGLIEDFAKALALRVYPGTRWPRHEDDTIDDRQGRHPVRWHYAEISRDLAKFAIDFLARHLVTVDEEWKPIESAPKDGKPLQVWQDGEIYVAKYTDGSPARLCWRTHQNFEHSKHHLIDAEFEGKSVKAKLPYDEPWKEEYRHDWTLWTRGFEFKPTHWRPLPKPPQDLGNRRA